MRAGCPAAVSRQVHSVEWWLANRADALITCSTAMRDEVAELFEVDPAAITVAAQRDTPRGGTSGGRDRVAAARARHAPAAHRCCSTFGRLEYEKGVHDLIAALPRIRAAHPGTRLLVAGTGTASAMLEATPVHRVLRSVTVPRATCPTTIWPPRSPPPTPSCCPAGTSRSGSWRCRPRPRALPLVASTAGGLGEVVVTA